MKHFFNTRWLYMLSVALIAFGCEPEEDPEKAIASFQFEQDETDFRKVTFTNFSQNAVSYAWDFGDETSSTEESPVHTFEVAGTYSVTLSATGEGGDVATKTEEVIITDPDLALKALTGDVSKSWKLIRDVSTGNYPFAVGPQSRSEIWYALGLQEEIGMRPCLLTDEFIFSLDGAYEYKTNGDFWAEGGVFATPGCTESVNSNYVNASGVDVSAWNSGVHSFEYNVAESKLTVTGLGAFVGLSKVASTEEVSVPQQSVTYDVVRLVDGDVDTLIVETTLTAAGGYWRFVLVHYDNPADEPEIPGSSPAVGFTYSVDNATRVVTFNNTSAGADTYSWNFGDGSSSTDANPTHTYAANGAYEVVLTATNTVGSSSSTQSVTVGAAEVTLADLHGGSAKTWKLKPVAGAFRVGPGKGSGEWFASSVDDVTNRACQFDDEFKFASTLGFEIDTKGQVWAEGYMGGSNACTDDTALTGVYVDLASDNTHTFEFIASTASTPARIKVSGTGAYIGFSKAFNGGEYQGTESALQTSITYDVVSYLSVGGVETLDISVAINAEGTAWWSMTMVAQ